MIGFRLHDEGHKLGYGLRIADWEVRWQAYLLCKSHEPPSMTAKRRPSYLQKGGAGPAVDTVVLPKRWYSHHWGPEAVCINLLTQRGIDETRRIAIDCYTILL